MFHELAELAGLPAKALTLVGEKSLAELHTRPDFAVQVHKVLNGFIEVKAPGKGANPKKYKGHDKEQWDKLKALPNLLYTDGNEFSLWRDGEPVGKIIKLDGDIETSGAKLDASDGLMPLINDFLSWQPIPPKSVKELARVSARLCRFLRDEVIEQLEISNAPLTELKEDWRVLLFPDADDPTFADGYAQAVTFGLLMAKSKNLSLANGLDQVAKELGKTNTLIGTALRLLTEQDLSLGPSLDTLTRVLDVVSWAEIAKGDPEAWLYFYEDFLEVYDNKLRKLTGSYYTPPEVVQTMVRLCDEALRSSKRFAVAEGLAGNQVHIADPAVGSGTFLLAVLRSIAATVAADEGEGAVAAKIEEAAKRLYGFELQFGAFAVAQLRLLAEMIELGASNSPQLFVTDTLSDPHATFEGGTGIYKEISKSQQQANEIKRAQPITVVIGNPPYKDKAKNKGAWIESGSANRVAPLKDWQPPNDWAVGTHTHKLRNLYVYFWRWATWKVFEQGAGGRDLEPPIEEQLSGMVCYITVAGFLNGPGFQKMRSDLRRDCDEIWIIDCSPDGYQPPVSTRIFEGVQQAVCIVLASKSPEADNSKPAQVKFRSLSKGHREDKFAELGDISLEDNQWQPGAKEWRAPFLPEFSGGWGDFVALDNLIGDSGMGTMPGRTWVIAPDKQTLEARWQELQREPLTTKRASLFHPHPSGDRTVDKSSAQGLGRHHDAIQSIEYGIKEKKSDDPEVRILAHTASDIITPTRYGFRSFDRQWIIPDNRVINRPNPSLWKIDSSNQIYLSALMSHDPGSGPSITTTALIPDLHQYKGSFGGRVFTLWKDAKATEANIPAPILATLAKSFGEEPDPVDIFVYVAALLAHPDYTKRFREDLIRPGLRVPLTADKKLFAEAAEIGKRVIWLHTFGERFADPDATPPRPSGPPRLPEGQRPTITKEGAVPATAEDFPDTIDHDAAKQRLLIGKGFVDNVPTAVWKYEVSGKQVLRQWFSYRKKDRSRPLIGDKRPPSPLGDIQPDHWLPEYTSELLNVINILALLVEMEPEQANLLQRICDGPLIPASKIV
ncbi:type ISP restriction/modification enzyme [Parasphingorhabdus sp.]|uniref:type ISP restriction/modification enzyme n=1 Tax=Parasphingorhabdus sp. TaxID=2709688 RepID=UPI0035931945